MPGDASSAYIMEAKIIPKYRLVSVIPIFPGGVNTLFYWNNFYWKEDENLFKECD